MVAGRRAGRAQGRPIAAAAATSPTGCRRLASWQTSARLNFAGSAALSPWHPRSGVASARGEKGDEYGYVEAARGYDDIRKVADDKDELTATAGDGLWRVDFGDLAEEDWGSQWTMTQDEWKSVERLAKETSEPLQALQVFEDAGLRRVNPDISAGMLKIIADKAKSARVDREELSEFAATPALPTSWECAWLRRDAVRILSPRLPVANAAWAVGVISTERANSAEMEVLAARAAQVTEDISKRGIADLAWALASCRHASEELFQQIGIRAAVTGLKGFKAFDISTLRVRLRPSRSRRGRPPRGPRPVVRRRRRGRYWQGGGRRQRREDGRVLHRSSPRQHRVVPRRHRRRRAASPARSPRSGGEICARGEAAAAEGATVDPSLDGDRIQYGSWKGKNLNQINQAIVAVESAGGAEALGLRPAPDSLTAAAESAWMAQRRPPWSPGTSATSRRSFPTWARSTRKKRSAGATGLIFSCRTPWVCPAIRRYRHRG